MLAGTGYDWLLIDTEHSPVTTEGTMPLLQAAAPYPVSASCGPPGTTWSTLKKLLDQGAQTLLVPYVQSAEEAARAVAAVHYPTRRHARRRRHDQGQPLRRGDRLCPAGQRGDLPAGAGRDRRGLVRLEEIAAVEGVDGIFIGPSDLAASMGFPGQPSHPEVMAAVFDAVRRIGKAGRRRASCRSTRRR